MQWPPAMQPTVLVVEENAVLRRFMEQALAARPFRVSAVATLADVHRAPQQPPPDLVVMGLNRDGANTVRQVEQLRALGPCFPVIGTFAFEDLLAEARGSLELHLSDFLMKPFTAQDLLASVETVLGQLDADAEGTTAAPLPSCIRLKTVRERLTTRAARKRALRDLGEQALSGIGPSQLFELTVRRASALLGIELVSLLELEPSGETFKLGAAVGWPREWAGVATVSAGPSTVAGYVLRADGPVVIEDLPTESRFTPSPALVAAGVVSILGVAIGGPGRRLGVLGALSRSPRTFTSGDLEFFQSMANVVGLALSRNSAEGEARRQAAILRSTFDALAEGVWVVDERGDLLLHNPAAKAILVTIPAGKGLGDAVAHYGIWGDDGEPYPVEDLPIARALRGEPVTREPVFMRNPAFPAGAWLEVSARPVRNEKSELRGAVATFRDATTEHAAQERARRTERDLRAALSAIPDGVAVVRGHNVLWCNQGWATLVGVSGPAALAGADLAEALRTSGGGAFLTWLDAPLTREGDEPSYAGEVVRRSGQPAWAEIARTGLADFEGGPATLLAARDLTEQHSLQGQLVMSDRLATVGLLAQGVAHEINNPLASIIANLGLLRRSNPPNPLSDGERADILADVDEAAQHIAVIVRDLRMFAKGPADTRAVLDLRPVVESSLRLARARLRPGSSIQTQFGASPRVQANAARVGQVVLNLVVNAIQARPAKSPEQHQAGVELGTTPEGWARITVRDNGAGIAPGVQARLFNHFFTTKPEGEGTGLGLSISRRIVEDLGGRLWFESSAGAGTRFHVELPPSPDPGLDPRESPPLVAAARRRVLVVDDEPAMLSVIRRILAPHHEVVTVQSAARALEVLRASSNRPDVVLTDMMMPGMTGVELYQGVLSADPLLARRFVFMTGGAFGEGVSSALQSLENPRVEKPFHPQDLLEAVALVLEAAGRQPD